MLGCEVDGHMTAYHQHTFMFVLRVCDRAIVRSDDTRDAVRSAVRQEALLVEGVHVRRSHHSRHRCFQPVGTSQAGVCGC